MDEEKLKDETKENENSENNILNGTSNSGGDGTFTEKVKSRIKKGAIKKIIKAAIIKTVAVLLIIVMSAYIVLAPIFKIFDFIKDMTLANMGQSLPNADSSNYSTTTGIGGKIAGQALSGLKNIINTALNAITNFFTRWKFGKSGRYRRRGGTRRLLGRFKCKIEICY